MNDESDLTAGSEEVSDLRARIDRRPDVDIENLAAGFQFGKYRIEERLGAGSFGVVYRAGETSSPGRTVAIKIRRPLVSVLSEEETRNETRAVEERYGRETRYSEALRARPGANVPVVYEFGQAVGHFYIAMEYIAYDFGYLTPGLAQTAYHQKGNAWATSRTDELDFSMSVANFAALARVVEVIHTAKCVHRDLKPENVRMRLDDNHKPVPVVLDFGVACRIGEPQRADAPVGTKAYRPLEMASGDTVASPQQDVFALGAMLYDSALGITQYHPPAPRDPCRVRALGGSFRKLAPIVQRAMTADPKRQYRSAGEFAAALARLARRTNPNGRSWLSTAASAVVVLVVVWFILGIASLKGAFDARDWADRVSVEAPSALAWTPDGRLIIGQHSGGCRRYDPGTKRFDASYGPNDSPVETIVASGRHVATLSQQGEIHVYADEGERRRTVPPPPAGVRVRIAPGPSDQLWILRQDRLLLIDLNTGDTIRDHGHVFAKSGIAALAKLAEEYTKQRAPDWRSSLIFSANSKGYVLASSAGAGLEVISSHTAYGSVTRQYRYSLPGGVYVKAADASDDGQLHAFALSDGTTQVLYGLAMTMPVIPAWSTTRHSPASAVKFITKEHLLCCGTDGQIYLRDRAGDSARLFLHGSMTLTRIPLIHHEAPSQHAMLSSALSQDNRFLATTGWDGVRIWNLPTGE